VRGNIPTRMLSMKTTEASLKVVYSY
jgi:hypothetical protein